MRKPELIEPRLPREESRLLVIAYERRWQHVVAAPPRPADRPQSAAGPPPNEVRISPAPRCSTPEQFYGLNYFELL